MKNLSALQQNLTEKGYAFVDGVPPQSIIDTVITGFRSLIEEAEKDENFLKKWSFDLSKTSNEGVDDGLIRRSGGIHDKKYFFHYRPRLLKLLEWSEVDTTDYKEFLKACDVLYKHSLGLACSVAEKIMVPVNDNETQPLSYFISTEASKNQHTLRLLDYDVKNSVEEFLAQPHADRDTLTFPIADSHPGLVLLTRDGSQFLYNQKGYPGQTLVFGGKKLFTRMGGNIIYEKIGFQSDLQAVPSVFKYIEKFEGGQITPTPHWVRLPDGMIGVKRWSIVFFAHDATAQVPEKPGTIYFPELDKKVA